MPPTGLPTEWNTEAFDTIFSSTAQTPVFRWFLNSVIAAFGMGVVVLAHGGPGGLRARAAGVPRQAAGVRDDHRDAVRAADHLPRAELRDHPGARLARHAAGRDLPARGRARSACSSCASSSSGCRASSRRRPCSTGRTAGRSSGGSSCRSPRPALATLFVLSVLSNWNDFLWPLYVLLQPGAPDARAGARAAAGGERDELRAADGRRPGGQRAGAASSSSSRSATSSRACRAPGSRAEPCGGDDVGDLAFALDPQLVRRPARRRAAARSGRPRCGRARRRGAPRRGPRRRPRPARSRPRPRRAGARGARRRRGGR